MDKPNRKSQYVSVEEQEEENNNVVENDNTTATSQHDGANNGLQQQQDIDDEGYVRMWKSKHKLRRTLKKPDFFKPMSPRKQMSKHGSSSSVSVNTAKAKNIAKKKVKKGKDYQYDEVDYIFGKRPDESCKGKLEYHVMWKATWEPEENMRFCPESIEAYECGQNIGQKEKESTAKEQRSHDDEENAGDNVNMRKKAIKGSKHSKDKHRDGPPSKKQMAIEQPGDTQEHLHLLANDVDYIFDKRESRKGKLEYRVMWKATWEPEENLRFCPESIESYERGQSKSIGHNSIGKEQRSHDDDEDAEDNVTMRKKTVRRGKHTVKESTDGRKVKEKTPSPQPSTSQTTDRTSEEPTDSNLRSEDVLMVESVMKGDIEQEHLLANFIAHLIDTSNTEMALAAIKQNFDGHFSSFEHRKVHVELMLLNYLEICAKLNEGDRKDPAMLAKATALGIETMRLAEKGNNSTMGNNLVKQVDSTLNLIWSANLDLINHHPLRGMRNKLAQDMCEMLKEKEPKWEMSAGQNS